MKILIAYFSAEGHTSAIASLIAEKLQADIFEIRPVKPYSKADLNWTNPLSRCNREKIMGKEVPVEGRIPDLQEYDIVLLGFPIWYGGAPNAVNTFAKAYDWNNIGVYAFATSGGSPVGKTAEKLKPYLKNVVSAEVKLVHSAAEVIEWINEKIEETIE